MENINLLLSDLCGRLPYNVKIKTVKYLENVDKFIESASTIHSIDILSQNVYCMDSSNTLSIVDVKPYLFPLSSMTDEQKVEFTIVQSQRYTGLYPYPSQCSKVLDWLNKNHFDYRDLIEKGLALDATNKNIY